MPRLGLLLVIGTVANVITALAALFVAVQFWTLDVSDGSLTVDISGPVVTAMVLNSANGSIGAVMRDSVVSSSRSNGILNIAGAAGTSLTIERSSLVNNVGNAVQSSGASSLVTINESTITGNQVGLSFINGGGMQSGKNNLIFGNGTNGTPVGGISLQ